MGTEGGRGGSLSYREGGLVLRCGMKCGTYSMAVPRGLLNLRGGGGDALGACELGVSS